MATDRDGNFYEGAAGTLQALCDAPSLIDSVLLRRRTIHAHLSLHQEYF